MTTIFVYEYVTALGARGDMESPLAPSLLREGRAMLDALVADLQAISEVDVRTIEEEDESSFRDLAGRSDFTLVIAPEFERILEERCRRVEEAGGRLLGPSSAAVRLTSDKLNLFQHFVEHQVPTPRTWPLGQEPSDLSPVVCKPRDGAGSQAISLLQCSEPAAQARDLSSNPLLALRAQRIAQEYIDGFAASVAFLIGPSECVALEPCAQHLSTDGTFRYLGGSTPLPDNLAKRAIDLARRAVESVSGLLGYVGVDIVLGAEAASDRVIEINPRLTTSYVGLRQLADFNIAEMMLKIVCSEPTLEQRWRSGQVHFTPETTTFANPSQIRLDCLDRVI